MIHAYEIDSGPGGVAWEMYANTYDRDTYLGTVATVRDVYDKATQLCRDVVLHTYAAYDARDAAELDPVTPCACVCGGAR